MIGGGNGCGKSAILEAILFAKEAAGSYTHYFRNEKNIISSDADFANVRLELQFNDLDRKFAETYLKEVCPEQAALTVKFIRGDELPIVNCPTIVRNLLKSFAPGQEIAPGFFDYFDAHRRIQEQRLNSINLSISDEQAKHSLTDRDNKYNHNKQYLAVLKIRDLQKFQDNSKSGKPVGDGPLQEVKGFFDDFFSPMTFVDVDFQSDPIRFIVHTPSGEVDIDDISSGEKEIFNTYLHFHQFNPNGSIILFDEPDIHLHPDFSRRYIEVLKSLGKDNQFWVTTHSPEMMLGTEIDCLYTVAKVPFVDGKSQFFPIVNDVSRHNLLKEVMGSADLIGINRKIVFIEGEKSSADVAIYEAYYPPNKYDLKFVPGQSKRSVTRIAQRVNELLSSSIGFPEYYCIVDGDCDVDGVDLSTFDRLFRLPKYHVENFLLDEAMILELTSAMLRDRSPYSSVSEVSDVLKGLVISDVHVNKLTSANLNSRLNKLSKEIEDAVFSRKPIPINEIDFDDIRPSGLTPTFGALFWRRR